ncbi:MAG: preprotein translocase subunit SecE [Myxococcota bacterium]|jgi:preprotein translocase subunit SecE|nr:preprotein translocase subunit SecE [Spirochaeta sp.]RPG08860.1 MAG: preprotein translocase subunit SecE [Proteobacteria bacterium TMED72]
MASNPANWVSGLRQYFTEVMGEYRKITWPAQNEALAGSISVIVVVAVITTVLGLIDFGLSHVMQLILD